MLPIEKTVFRSKLSHYIDIIIDLYRFKGIKALCNDCLESLYYLNHLNTVENLNYIHYYACGTGNIFLQVCSWFTVRKRVKLIQILEIMPKQKITFYWKKMFI